MSTVNHRLREVIAARRDGTVLTHHVCAPDVRTQLPPTLLDFADSVADRVPKSRGERTSQVGYLFDPFRLRKLYYESLLEAKWLMVLIASPSVLDVREQQSVRKRFPTAPDWTADYLVTWLDQSRSAYEVKYGDDVVRKQVRELLIAVAHAAPGFADDFRIVTEQHLDEITVENAKYVIACACDFDRQAQTIVHDVLVARPGTRMTLDDIGEATGLGARGRRAAVALVQSGLLSPLPGQRIDRSCVFEIVGARP